MRTVSSPVPAWLEQQEHRHGSDSRTQGCASPAPAGTGMPEDRVTRTTCLQHRHRKTGQFLRDDGQKWHFRAKNSHRPAKNALFFCDTITRSRSRPPQARPTAYLNAKVRAHSGIGPFRLSSGVWSTSYRPLPQTPERTNRYHMHHVVYCRAQGCFWYASRARAPATWAI